MVFKVNWELFSALISKCLVTLNHLAVGRNRLKVWDSWLHVVHIGSILGHPVHLLATKEHLSHFTSVAVVVKQTVKVFGPLILFQNDLSVFICYLFPTKLESPLMHWLFNFVCTVQNIYYTATFYFYLLYYVWVCNINKGKNVIVLL